MPWAQIHASVRLNKNPSTQTGESLAKGALGRCVLAMGRGFLLAGFLSGTLALGQNAWIGVIPPSPAANPLLKAIGAAGDPSAAIEGPRAAGKGMQAFADAYRTATAPRARTSATSALAAASTETPTTQRSSGNRGSSDTDDSRKSSTYYSYSSGSHYYYYYPYYGSSSIISVPDRNFGDHRSHRRDGSGDRLDRGSMIPGGDSNGRNMDSALADAGNRGGRAAPGNEACVPPMPPTPHFT